MFVAETPQTDINLSSREQAEISRILHAKNLDDKQKFQLLSQLQKKIAATPRAQHNVQFEAPARKPLKAMQKCGSDTDPADGDSLRRPSIDSKVRTAKLSARRLSHATREMSQTVRHNSVKPS